MNRPLRVLFVASECAPFAKTGGLADVAGALPPALARRGVDVRVVMPLYASVDWNMLEPLDGVLIVPTGLGPRYGGVRMSVLPRSDVRVYFLEHRHYFDRPHLYGPPGEAYWDNLERFAFLSRGALELSQALGFLPDVVHANDWQAALVPVYVDTVEWGRPLFGSATLFTIHNLEYQGVFDPGSLPVTGLGFEHLNSREFEHFGTLNLLKAAFYRSTLLSTVSPTYAREIQTSDHGFGLDGVLRERSGDLKGILNGIDDEEWNPATDPHLPARFHVDDLSGKAICKRELQREAGLPIRGDVPLFGLVSRLIRQKGIDVLVEALASILSLDVQLVVLGTGDPDLAERLTDDSRRFPRRLCFWHEFNNAKAHRIEAGSDLFLMPSRFEPCGLNQMYSLRYGTLPIVRATGGLADTVESYDERSGSGTGFVFNDLNASSMYDTVGWAVSTWYDRRNHFASMRRRAMAQDFSWDHAAQLYEAVYEEAVSRRSGRL
jgi:starch synthase